MEIRGRVKKEFCGRLYNSAKKQRSDSLSVFPVPLPVSRRRHLQDFLKLTIEGRKRGIAALFRNGENGLLTALQCRAGGYGFYAGMPQAEPRIRR